MTQSKNLFSYQSWVHAVAGATGSVVAMSTFYPLDTIRYRLQVEDPEKRRKTLSTWQLLFKIVSEEGIQSLYRGIIPVLQSLCISNFVYFYTFHGLKSMYDTDAGQKLSDKKPQQNALRDLLLGSIAGIINVLTTTPFWVVNTRLKGNSNGAGKKTNSTTTTPNQKYTNLLDGLCFIARTEGIHGLWSGTLPSLLLVINPALQFMMYEYLKRRIDRLSSKVRSSAITFFMIGAISKAFATILTYPLQLIQTKLRHGGGGGGRGGAAGVGRTSASTATNIDNKNSLIDGGKLVVVAAAMEEKSESVFEMIMNIMKKQGVYGLFRGLEAKLWQTVLTAALMFAAYEKIAKFVMSLLTRKMQRKI